MCVDRALLRGDDPDFSRQLKTGDTFFCVQLIRHLFRTFLNVLTPDCLRSGHQVRSSDPTSNKVCYHVTTIIVVGRKICNFQNLLYLPPSMYSLKIELLNWDILVLRVASCSPVWKFVCDSFRPRGLRSSSAWPAIFIMGQADEDRRPCGRKLSQTNFQTGEQEATRNTKYVGIHNL